MIEKKIKIVVGVVVVNIKPPATGQRQTDKESIWSDHRLFIIRLESDSLVFFSSRFVCSMTICPISVTFFFTVHSFNEYVESNQSKYA